MLDTQRRDAVVIGSGFGGAVAACRLAQAGFEVTILERGRRYAPDDFPALPQEKALLPDLARWRWQDDRGLWDVQDLGELVSVQAAGYGGGSLIYANVHLRPPREVFDERWPEVYRAPSRAEDAHELDPYYDLVASMLAVSPLPNEKAADIVKADQLRRAASHRKREAQFFYPPLAINFEARGKNGSARKACTYCAKCSTGCPEGAKNTLDRNYLAIAEEHGAKVMTLCEVVQLRSREDGWQIEYRDHALATTHTLDAHHVFLCAGAVHTARLLFGAKTSSALSHVGIGYYPNADAVGMVYDADHPQHPSHGPTIAASLVHYSTEHQSKKASFFLIQDGGYGAELARALGTLRGSAWAGRNRITRSGTANVEASVPPHLPKPRQQTDSSAAPIPSIVDAMTSAVLERWHGDFGAKLRELSFGMGVRAWLTGVVEATVLDSVRERLDRLPRSWREPVLKRAVLPFIHRVVGDSASIAMHAADALWSVNEAASRAARLFGYESTGAERRTMLLAMGRDATPGVLQYRHGKLSADLDLFHLAPLYQQEEALMADIAESLGGELRLNPAWSYLGKPVTVHGQGGCRMSDEAANCGALTPDGKVRGVAGLYVLDGSALSTSVGVNPSATIAAVAERNVLRFIREQHARPWGAGPASLAPATAAENGEEQYLRQRQAAQVWADKAKASNWSITPPPFTDSMRDNPLSAGPVGIQFDETMRGFLTELAPEGSDGVRFPNPITASYDGSHHPSYADDAYRDAAAAPGREFLELRLSVGVRHLQSFLQDAHHRLDVHGTIDLVIPGGSRISCSIEHGSLELFVPRYKKTALVGDMVAAQERATGTPYHSQPEQQRRNDVQRFMVYRLPFAGPDGARWELQGYKRVRQDEGLDLWDDTTTLFVRLIESHRGRSHDQPEVVRAAGRLQLGALSVMDQVKDIRTPGANTPEREAWAKATFLGFFLGTLQQVYTPQLMTLGESLFTIGHGRS
jgi:choline dehydrogenase-like flavoprotein